MGLVHEIQYGSRIRAVIAVVVGLIAGVYVSYRCVVDLLGEKGCAMHPPYPVMVLGGVLALLGLVGVWWLGSWVFYGVTHLPQAVVETIQDRSRQDRERTEYKKAMRRLRGPMYLRMIKGLGTILLHLACFAAIIAVCCLVGYLLAYVFLSIYC